jgi:chaperonin GroEL
MMSTSPNSNDPSSVLSGRHQPVNITKDGVTVARSLNKLSADCRLKNIGANLVIDASERANEECGDGTTTSALLAGYIMREGSKLLMSSSSINPIELRRGIQLAVTEVCTELDKMARKIDAQDPLIKAVAMVSSNGDHELA